VITIAKVMCAPGGATARQSQLTDDLLGLSLSGNKDGEGEGFEPPRASRPGGFQLHFRSWTRCLSSLSPPTRSRYGLRLQINNRSRPRTLHGKSTKSLAEGRRFELRNPVWGRGFQDDSAV